MAETTPISPEGPTPTPLTIEEVRSLPLSEIRDDQPRAADIVARLPVFTTDQLQDPGVNPRLRHLYDAASKDQSTDTLFGLQESAIRQGILEREDDGVVKPTEAGGDGSKEVQRVLQTYLTLAASEEIPRALKESQDDAVANHRNFHPAFELADLTARQLMRGVSLSESELKHIAAQSNLTSGEQPTFPEKVQERVTQIIKGQEAAKQTQAVIQAENERVQAADAERRQEEARAQEAAARKQAENQQKETAQTERWEAETLIAGDEQQAIDRAHAEALRQDWATRESIRIREEFGRKIEQAVHPDMVIQLTEERKKLEAELKGRIESTNKRAAETFREVQTAVREKSNLTKTFRRGEVKDLEEQAAAIHDTLNLESMPFQVKKEGGWRFRPDRRSPKVVEAYYRSTSDPNVVVVERYLRRSDKLLSQTVFTTEQPIRDTGNQEYSLPRGFMGRMKEVRRTDQTPDVHRTTMGDYLTYGSVDLASVGRQNYGATPSELARTPSKRRRPGSWLFNFFNLDQWN